MEPLEQSLNSTLYCCRKIKEEGTLHTLPATIIIIRHFCLQVLVHYTDGSLDDSDILASLPALKECLFGEQTICIALLLYILRIFIMARGFCI